MGRNRRRSRKVVEVEYIEEKKPKYSVFKVSEVYHKKRKQAMPVYKGVSFDYDLWVETELHPDDVTTQSVEDLCKQDISILIADFEKDLKKYGKMGK